MPIGVQISKNGDSFTLDWTDNLSLFQQEATELVDAMLATYAPSLPAETNCIADGHCIKGNFGDITYLYTPDLGQAIWVPAQQRGAAAAEHS